MAKNKLKNTKLFISHLDTLVGPALASSVRIIDGKEHKDGIIFFEKLNLSSMKSQEGFNFDNNLKDYMISLIDNISDENDDVEQEKGEDEILLLVDTEIDQSDQ